MKLKGTKTSYLVEAIAAIFIFLFLYTALSKLSDFTSFKNSLRHPPFIGYSGWVAILLPVSEILVVILLFIPGTKRKGLYCSCILMILFTLYVSYMLAYVKHLPCSCGGVISQLSWKQHLIFNIVMTIVAFLGVKSAKHLNEIKAVNPGCRDPIHKSLCTNREYLLQQAFAKKE